MKSLAIAEAVFLHIGCCSLCPTSSVKALKALSQIYSTSLLSTTKVVKHDSQGQYG